MKIPFILSYYIDILPSSWSNFENMNLGRTFIFGIATWSLLQDNFYNNVTLTF